MNSLKFKQTKKNNKVKINMVPLIEEFEIENYDDIPLDVTRENIGTYYEGTPTEQQIETILKRRENNERMRARRVEGESRVFNAPLS